MCKYSKELDKMLNNHFSHSNTKRQNDHVYKIVISSTSFFFIFACLLIIFFNLGISNRSTANQKSNDLYKKQVLMEYYKTGISNPRNNHNGCISCHDGKNQKVIKKNKKMPSGIFNRYFRIAIVSSNGLFDPFIRPQIVGITDALNQMENNVYWDIETFYLNSSQYKIPMDDVKCRIQTIKSFVKRFNPNVIVTLGNLALKTIGIKFANENRYVFFSETGPYVENTHMVNKKFLGGVTIYPQNDIEKFFEMLKKSNCIGFFTNTYILSSKNMNPGEIDIINEHFCVVKKFYPDAKIKKFLTSNELISFIRKKDINGTNNIYIMDIKRIYDEYNKKMLDQIDTNRLISMYNKGQLEVSNNILFPKISNTMIGISPDFYEIGKRIGYMIFKLYYSNKMVNQVFTFNSKLVISYKRMMEGDYGLVYEKLYKNMTNMF